MAEEKVCSKCGAIITEENKCSCKPKVCSKCCECDDSCECGCGKKEEPSK